MFNYYTIILISYASKVKLVMSHSLQPVDHIVHEILQAGIPE